MDNKPRAVVLMILSALSFAFMGAMVKLAGDIPLAEKVLFRNMVSLAIAFITLKKSSASMFGKKENQKYLLGRSMLGLSGVLLYFYAINNINLGNSAILNKLSPFFVTVFAALFLKEKLSKVQIPALFVVFVGALFIIQPKMSFDMIPSMAGVGSAICAGGAYTLVRYLKDREQPATIVFYFSLISVLGMIPLTAMNFVIPSPSQCAFLVMIGVFAAMGQFTLTYAYKLAPASEVSIFNYFSVVFSAVIGFVMFEEVMDGKSILGAVLIIGTAFFLYLYNRKYSTN
ncbi:DMT family transporter [Oceanirhabdus sp. W0125-5]|uniref:DMT family transporter n=1 Tax=Oceanirhabdus sp. W0125-5 TaxID=2999116 RepID=UPI0022F33E76|nr:DMT family transporter [Oceanirhabdus sp. W0125-5]WBW98311.1 DMT family transporter [Oceanirhabdus sp. W0125-5]